MKLAIKVTLGCLLLIFALLFGGCSWLPFSQESSSETPKNNKAELEKQEKDKQGELVKLKEDLSDQQKRVEDEKSKCEEMKKATIKDGKDPEDVKISPKTVAQCKDNVSSAEGKVTKTNEQITKSAGELTAIQKQKSELPPDDSNSGKYGWLNTLLIGVAGVIGLGLLLGGLYMLLSRKIDKAIGAERTLNQQSFDRIKTKHSKFNDLFAEHGKVMNDLERLIKLQHGKIEVLEFKLKETAGSYGSSPQSFVTPPEAIRPEPQFPVSVENYLNKVRNQAQKASADTIGGLLIQDPSKNEEFMIVKDSALDHDLFYAVPSFVRFQTKSEYLTYYQNYYNCENPSGGAVWIVKPTVVRRVDDGWQLQQKGELEFK